ncbi:uncharacterized protein LOC129585544 [Paramacrobiotus metropolitanus]|uniref:uncharacterized protein LOC129585544 n=1 Tax=Paramacrobiotus metropolitanus TaxID=2943436 RepID=UPI002445EB03|nr:uncharacterized protein LOC129585544 [Paramacrobiotus metropolitanus]
MVSLKIQLIIALVTIDQVVRFSLGVDYDENDVVIPADVFSDSAAASEHGDDEQAFPVLWPNRLAIPYDISDDFNTEQRMKIQTALRIMERQTKGCVMFQKIRSAENDTDFIFFKRGQECHSYIGMVGGRQDISLADECLEKSAVILHEVMHALGFNHEHARFDRDQHIILHESRILENETYNFYASPASFYHGTKYDYDSIMHYPATTFSKNSTSPVIIPRRGLIVRIGMGQNLRLSPGDIAKIQTAYKCPVYVTEKVNASTVVETEAFPLFSSEPMTSAECLSQINDNCSATIVFLLGMMGCMNYSALEIRCNADTNISVLEGMAVKMAAGPLRPVMIEARGRQLESNSFSPVRKIVIRLRLMNCTNERITGRIAELNFVNLLHLEAYECQDLVIRRMDFMNSTKLRIIILYSTTIKHLERDSFADLPNLRILTLEALWSGQQYEYGNFAPSMRSFLRNLHCNCEYAWYRAWWHSNRQLKLRVEYGELYALEGNVESPAYVRKDIYHPVDCAADPFPLGISWVNYENQIEYSINEPKCNPEALTFELPMTTIRLHVCRLKFLSFTER